MNKLHVAASVLIGIFIIAFGGGTYFRYPFSGLIAGRHRIINHRLCLDYFVGNTGAAVVTINQREISRFPLRKTKRST
ncbi:hypothetical protein P7H19_10500 [Paenibacillus larvae]|nr:hypothetical protein [Paenibacillus larvae]MDT2236635.1 hypothetical protein [Paenibacillus larvae]